MARNLVDVVDGVFKRKVEFKRWDADDIHRMGRKPQEPIRFLRCISPLLNVFARFNFPIAAASIPKTHLALAGVGRLSSFPR